MSQFAFNPFKVEPQQKQKIQSSKFYEYTKDNFYRTSYGTMDNKVNQKIKEQHQSKNMAITGYGGFIPQMNSESRYSNSYTNITKECFASNKLGRNPFGLSSTGFNTKTYDFKDESKHSVSHKYGQSSIIKNHPCCDAPQWKNQTKDSFQNPQSLNVPTYRSTDKFLVQNKIQNRLSGYQSNINICDGQGWVPHKVLDGDRVQTNYRINLSREKPIHRSTILLSLRSHK